MRACNRVLKSGGVTAYLVIVDADESSASEAMRAGGLDGGVVRTGDDYVALMTRAGFQDIELFDVTAEYETTVVAWIREWDEGRADLEQLVGAETYDERQLRRRDGLKAIRNGLRKRYLISATGGEG